MHAGNSGPTGLMVKIMHHAMSHRYILQTCHICESPLPPPTKMDDENTSPPAPEAPGAPAHEAPAPTSTSAPDAPAPALVLHVLASGTPSTSVPAPTASDAPIHVPGATTPSEPSLNRHAKRISTRIKHANYTHIIYRYIKNTLLETL